MSLEVGGRGLGSGKVRAGAALALVLATAGGLPAQAQTALDAADAAAPAGEPATADPADEQAKCERVYVFGRRVASSIATLPDPQDAPQIINVKFGAHVDNAIRFIPGPNIRVRTDLSATLFLTEPAVYHNLLRRWAEV